MALRITTIDQADRLILDFYRCAMLPLSADADPDGSNHADDLSTVGVDLATPPSAAADWNGDVFRRAGHRPAFRHGPGRVGAAEQCRRGHQRTGIGSSDPEYRRRAS